MATKFIGTKRRIEFNGHDVTHLTGMSLGSMGKVYDTYQTLSDPFDHDIEITEEASGSFDLIATDTGMGEQKFKEMMGLVLGHVDLADGDGTALANLDDDVLKLLLETKKGTPKTFFDKSILF